MDGASSPEDARPLAESIVSNATYIGMGPGRTDDQVSGDANDPFIIHRDNNATSYHNSVFTGGRTNFGIQIEDLASGNDDSANRWANGELEHRNNVWFNIGPDFDGASTTFEDMIQLTTDDDGNVVGDRGTAFRGSLADYLRNEDNLILSSSPYAISRENGNGTLQGFTPSPQGNDVTSGAVEPEDFGVQSQGVNDTWTQVSFKGAFGPGAEWNLAAGWAKITQDGTIQ
jgi:hypothetical protein